MTGTGSLHPDTTVVRNSDALSAAIDGDTILLVPQRECYIGMNGTAGAVWARLEMPTTVADLIAGLQNDFDGPPERIATEGVALLNEMVALDLVSIVDVTAG